MHPYSSIDTIYLHTHTNIYIYIYNVCGHQQKEGFDTIITYSFSNIFFFLFNPWGGKLSSIHWRMTAYDVQQRVKFNEFSSSSERSIIQTKRKYRQHFNVRASPCHNMIRNLIAPFERTGSVGDLPGRGSERTERTDVAMEAVQQSVLGDPSASTHRLSAQVGITRTSLQNFLRLDFWKFPYKIKKIPIS